MDYYFEDGTITTGMSYNYMSYWCQCPVLLLFTMSKSQKYSLTKTIHEISILMTLTVTAMYLTITLLCECETKH